MNPAKIATATGGTVTERAIAILIAAGVTSNRAIAEALGITARAVQKARKATQERTTVREPQFADANHSSQNEPQFANHSSPESTPSSPKRKVSPCTPSKEKQPPPSCAAADSSLAGQAPAEAAAADDFEKCRPIITALVRALYPWPNFPRPDRAGVEKFVRSALDTGHTVPEIREAADILIGKAIDDEEIRKPAVMFGRLLGDVRRDGSRKKTPIPAGAIRYGDGPNDFISRW